MEAVDNNQTSTLSFLVGRSRLRPSQPVWWFQRLWFQRFKL